jgi:hypothetical protein
MYRRPDGWKEFSQEEITAWVERFRASSLGLRRFAEQNGIPVQRLRYWVYGQPNPKPPAAEEVLPVEVAPVFQEINLPVSLPPQSWALEIGLPNGMAIRFHNLPKPVWLGSLVKALRRPC